MALMDTVVAASGGKMSMVPKVSMYDVRKYELGRQFPPGHAIVEVSYFLRVCILLYGGIAARLCCFVEAVATFAFDVVEALCVRAGGRGEHCDVNAPLFRRG